MRREHLLRSNDPLHHILRWPTERARRWTCDFVNSAKASNSFAAVVAIGSAVRPDVVSGDLDLIVISAEATSPHISPPMEIDLRVFPAATLAAQIAGGHDLLGWAVKFGKPLFQRHCFWDSVVEDWKDSLPLPSAKLARERARSGHKRLVKVLASGDFDAVHEQAISYLTQLARAELLDRGICPASRPELASQLRAMGITGIAGQLERLLRSDRIDKVRIDQVLKLTA